MDSQSRGSPSSAAGSDTEPDAPQLEAAMPRRRSRVDLSSDLSSFRLQVPLRNGTRSTPGSLGSISSIGSLQESRGNSPRDSGAGITDRNRGQRRGSLPAAWAKPDDTDGSPMRSRDVSTAVRGLLNTTGRHGDKLAQLDQVVSVLERVLHTVQDEQAETNASLERLTDALLKEHGDGDRDEAGNTAAERTTDYAVDGRFIKINVGGTVFTTLEKTLCSVPDSVFPRVLANPQTLRDSDGNIFFDRNPKYFELILDWLRDQDGAEGVVIGRDEWSADPAFWREIKFYALQDATCGMLYVVGGFNGDGTEAVKSVECFDPVEKRWRQCADTPSPTQGHGCIALDGKLYMIGGSVGGTVTGSHVYDPATDSWSTMGELNFARHAHGVVTLDGFIYAIGGLSPTDELLVSVERYCPTRNSWSVVSDLPMPRHSMGCAAHNNSIFVVGGFGSDQAPLASMETYNIDTNTWSMLPGLGSPRVWLSCVMLRGELYAIGGESNALEPVNTIEIYSFTEAEWKYGPAMLSKRSRPAATVLQGHIYVTGGESDGEPGLMSVEKYSPLTRKWNRAIPMQSARVHHAASTVITSNATIINGKT